MGSVVYLQSWHQIRVLFSVLATNNLWELSYHEGPDGVDLAVNRIGLYVLKMALEVNPL